MRALTGAPVFTYQTSEITNSFYENLVFDLIFLSMQSPQHYPVIAMTNWDRNDPSMTSSCNIFENYDGTSDVTDHSAIKQFYLINYSFSLLQSIEVADSTSTIKYIYMFRDPSGDNTHLSEFNGMYRESYWTGTPDTTLLTNVVSATGIDPRYSAAFGIFFVDKTEMAKCFKEFAIAHDRSTNSYR